MGVHKCKICKKNCGTHYRVCDDHAMFRTDDINQFIVGSEIDTIDDDIEYKPTGFCCQHKKFIVSIFFLSLNCRLVHFI
jgi:hypothetical protein